MIYRKKEVIKIGEGKIADTKKKYTIGILVSILIGVFLCLLPILVIGPSKFFSGSYGMLYEITAIIALIMAFTVFLSARMKYNPDPLLIGCKEIEDMIIKTIREKKGSINCNPLFNHKELYELLLKNESANYYGAEDSVSDIRDPNQITITRTSDNSVTIDSYEEIDDYLSGKKDFTDMSEDAQSTYLEEYDDD